MRAGITVPCSQSRLLMLLTVQSNDLSSPWRLFDELLQDALNRRTQVNSRPVANVRIGQVQTARLAVIEEITGHNRIAIASDHLNHTPTAGMPTTHPPNTPGFIFHTA